MQKTTKDESNKTKKKHRTKKRKKGITCLEYCGNGM